MRNREDRNRADRVAIIQDLERSRGSQIIVYFTGDRRPFGSRIAEDAVRPLYEHLLNLQLGKEVKSIDLFLYSRGGDVSVPWRIATMIREFGKEFHILIPYKAQSAATLLSLGADSIVMTKKAELGPIDPTLVRTTAEGGGTAPAQEIAVEDVNSFLSFIKERANINDQIALAQVVKTLADQVSPLTLGTVNRQNSHIRLAARKLLTSQKEKVDEEHMSTIIETLTEKMYSHGHGIGRAEARDIGLKILYPNATTEDKIWRLYLTYEQYFKLDKPIDPEVELANDEEKEITDLQIALIESAQKLHVFTTNVKLKKDRQIPPSPNINLNLNLQLPPNIQPQQLPAQLQQVMQQMMNQFQQQIGPLVAQEIARQSPLKGIAGRVIGGRWVQVV